MLPRVCRTRPLSTSTSSTPVIGRSSLRIQQHGPKPTTVSPPSTTSASARQPRPAEPSQDGIGPAIVIFRAESEDGARQFMEEDPFVSHGLFRASLHPFRAALVGHQTKD